MGRRSDRRSVDVSIEVEREADGRWIAEVPDLPGVMAYGQSREEAISKVKALALRVLADRLEHGESIPELGGVFTVPARVSGPQPNHAWSWLLCSGSAGPSNVNPVRSTESWLVPTGRIMSSRFMIKKKLAPRMLRRIAKRTGLTPEDL